MAAQFLRESYLAQGFWDVDTKRDLVESGA